MRVLKASGELEEFDAEKVRRACLRAGASERLAGEIVESVQRRAYEGIPTHEIYALAYKLLKQVKSGAEHRFGLKKALMKLGPEGHAFEDFVGRLLAAYGYRTGVRRMARGKCVSHEIDVVAENDHEKIMVECKFHNRQGIECHIQNPLYVRARFEDLLAAKPPAGEKAFTSAWLVTNTRLSSDAIAYAECVGLKAVGWKYPEGNTLEAMIERKGLYPVTVLAGLTPFEKNKLMEAGVVLLLDLLPPDAKWLATKTGLKAARIEALKAQASWLA